MTKENKPTKTFLVREIPTATWELFKIKSIQKGTTCNKAFLNLIDKYCLSLKWDRNHEK